jgi:hypothetical protein
LIGILKDNIEDRTLLNNIATRLRTLGGPSAQPVAALESDPIIEGEVVQASSKPSEPIKGKLVETEIMVPEGSVFTGNEFKFEFGTDGA